MKNLILLFFCTSISMYGQRLHHQMLSAQGKSTTASNGLYVSQTIGQQSAIGTSKKEGVYYGQGFQQSIWGRYIKSTINNSISTITYPNPFVETVNFQFSQTISDVISIMVFDIQGRLVYQEEKRPTQNILTISLPLLASSNYLVRLTAPNYNYYTQIIKKS
jgi:hypothetical protein